MAAFSRTSDSGCFSIMSNLSQEVAKRRTFAIISHPDAGKTTITEKVLLFGQAIQKAGTVKGKKSGQHAKSDWMEMEKERGISVTTSVMQFPYGGKLVNLLDTPGHEDFSEDTYRTLTAVDSALMVIDCAKGVEKRTIKLMEVCRLRDTPIMTFINKLDRTGASFERSFQSILDRLTKNAVRRQLPIGEEDQHEGDVETHAHREGPVVVRRRVVVVMFGGAIHCRSFRQQPRRAKASRRQSARSRSRPATTSTWG